MEREKMINEAIERMEILELLDLSEESVISDFKENNIIYASSPMNLGVMVGVLYKLSDAERRLVRKIEKKYDILVYHIIKNETSIGVMYALLSVSSNEDEWKADRAALKDIDREAAHPLAYVWNAGQVREEEENLSDGYGEWGSISIVKGQGGLCWIL